MRELLLLVGATERRRRVERRQRRGRWYILSVNVSKYVEREIDEGPIEKLQSCFRD